MRAKTLNSTCDRADFEKTSAKLGELHEKIAEKLEMLWEELRIN